MSNNGHNWMSHNAVARWLVTTRASSFCHRHNGWHCLLYITPLDSPSTHLLHRFSHTISPPSTNSWMSNVTTSQPNWRIPTVLSGNRREMYITGEGDLVWTRSAHSTPTWRLGIVLRNGMRTDDTFEREDESKREGESDDESVEDGGSQSEDNSSKLVREYYVQWVSEDGMTCRGWFSPEDGVINPNDQGVRRLVGKINASAVRKWEETADRLRKKVPDPEPELGPESKSVAGVTLLQIYDGSIFTQ
ncbi:hypothetical protein OF83DRAFT_440021 [Amylostereum chailletii]|nr:hypothetical protein OF83DRAFT_440021 [Amylostereum chailletii]